VTDHGPAPTALDMALGDPTIFEKCDAGLETVN
jgi:hypothetical protein